MIRNSDVFICFLTQVEDALAVHKLLVEKKKKIPRETLLSLLELAAYNNEVDHFHVFHFLCRSQVTGDPVPILPTV